MLESLLTLECLLRELFSVNKANVTRVTNGLGVNGPTDN